MINEPHWLYNTTNSLKMLTNNTCGLAVPAKREKDKNSDRHRNRNKDWGQNRHVHRQTETDTHTENQEWFPNTHPGTLECLTCYGNHLC